MRRTLIIGAALAAVLALASSIALGQGPGYGWGHGMMGPMGPGMMGGGYGPGMMRGYGPGGPLAGLDLSDAQQEKVFAIQEEYRRKNFDAMSKLRSEMFKLRRMYNADSVDPKALLEQQRKVDDLRRQMLGSRLEMRKQVESVLTPEQRKRVRQFGPWWAIDDSED